MLARLRSTNWFMSRRSLLQHQQTLRGQIWTYNSETIVQARQDYKVFQLLHPSKFKLVPTTSTNNNKKICPKGKPILQQRTLRIHHPWTPSLLRDALRSPILQGRSWSEMYVEARNSMRGFRLGQHITLRNFSAALVFIVLSCILAPVFVIGKVFVLFFPLISWLATPTVIVDPSLALVSDVTAAVTGDASAAGAHGWLLDGGVAVGVGVLQRTLLTITTIILIAILVLLPAVLRYLWYHYHITHWHQVPRNSNLMNDIKADHEHAYQPVLVYHHLVGDSIESLDGSDELSTLLSARKLLKHLTSSSSSSSSDVNGDFRHPQILPAALAQIVASYCNVVPDGVVIPTIGDDTPWIKDAYKAWQPPSASSSPSSSPAPSPSITSRSIQKYNSNDYLRANRKAAAIAAAMVNSETSSSSSTTTKVAEPTVAPISPTASSMSSTSSSSSSSSTVGASSVVADHIAQRAQMAAAIEKRLNKDNTNTNSDRSTCIGSSSGSSSSSNSSDSSTSSSSVVTNGSENDNKDNTFDTE
jgi:hypothetical protein